jgi:hypothetical protein
VRFEVSRVLDTIERHLTTDPLLAQAVVDVAAVARFVELDGGRTISLIRIGMVVDALGRYLHDGGVYLYPVAPRRMLSDPELTSKERMVLGRWTDQGLIEAAAHEIGERVPEIAELTGLPIVSLNGYDDLAQRYGFLRDAPLRVLTVSPRGGGALLTDGTGGTGGVVLRGPDEIEDRPWSRRLLPALLAIGKATPKGKVPPPDDEPAPDAGPAPDADTESAVVAAPPEPEPEPVVRQPEVPLWPDPGRVYHVPLPVPPAIRSQPDGVGTALMARLWRCDGFDCPSFGDERRIGQPVPHMRKGVPVCPRHDERLVDIGPRPPEIPVALIVDGLRRQRFMVTVDRPVRVGKEPDDPDDVSVEPYLHDAAASWIGAEHLRLSVSDGKLVVTDLGANGSLVWKRTDPQARPETMRLYQGRSYDLGEWDTVELYTGIELVHAERRPRGVDESPDEPASVLVDAPTVAVLRLPDRTLPDRTPPDRTLPDRTLPDRTLPDRTLPDPAP